MNTDFLNSKELLAKAQDIDLYEKLVVQLEKDFGRANIFFELPKNIPPEALRKALHEKIYVLLMEKFTSYLNLLYVIDVPERAFKEIQMTDTVEVARQVSFFILKREFQKVFLKQKFSV